MSLVNGLGMLLALYSALIYHQHTPQRAACEYLSIAGLIGILSWLILISTGQIKLNDVGLSAMIASVVMFGAPLVALFHIFQHHFTAKPKANRSLTAASIWTPREGLSLGMIGVSCLVSGSWLLYGVAIGDAFLSVPNGLGLLMSGLQLCVWCFAFPDEVQTGATRGDASTSSSLSVSKTASKDPFLKPNSVAPFIELKRF